MLDRMCAAGFAAAAYVESGQVKREGRIQIIDITSTSNSTTFFG
jgi:hypothetical protein